MKSLSEAAAISELAIPSNCKNQAGGSDGGWRTDEVNGWGVKYLRQLAYWSG